MRSLRVQRPSLGRGAHASLWSLCPQFLMTTNSLSTCCESSSRTLTDSGPAASAQAPVYCPVYESRLLATARHELNSAAALGVYGSPYGSSQGYGNYVTYGSEASAFYSLVRGQIPSHRRAPRPELSVCQVYFRPGRECPGSPTGWGEKMKRRSSAVPPGPARSPRAPLPWFRLRVARPQGPVPKMLRLFSLPWNSDQVPDSPEAFLTASDNLSLLTHSTPFPHPLLFPLRTPHPSSSPLPLSLPLASSPPVLYP